MSFVYGALISVTIIAVKIILAEISPSLEIEQVPYFVLCQGLRNHIFTGGEK